MANSVCFFAGPDCNPAQRRCQRRAVALAGKLAVPSFLISQELSSGTESSSDVTIGVGTHAAYVITSHTTQKSLQPFRTFLLQGSRR
jgi:hypothetical protein